MVSLSLAVASAAQATVTYLLLRRLPLLAASPPWLLMLVRLLLAGPLACLTGATLAAASFWAFGLQPVYPGTAWFIWWVGDMLGVLLLLPLYLAFESRPLRLRDALDRRLLVNLLVAATLGFGWTFYAGLLKQREAQGAMASDARVIAKEIGEDIARNRTTLAAFSGLFKASEFVDDDEFARFAREMLAGSSSVYAAFWAALEPQPQSATAAVPIRYAEPRLQVGVLSGLDLHAHPRVAPVLEKARDSGELAASGPMSWPEHAGLPATLLMVAPVYRHKQLPGSLEQRRKLLAGFAVVAVNLDSLSRMGRAAADEGLPLLGTYLLRARDTQSGEVLYADRELEQPWIQFLAEQIPIGFLDRQWWLDVAATPEVYLRQMNWDWWFVYVAGQGLFALAAYFLLLLGLRARESASVMQQLATSRRALESEQASRRRAEMEAANRALIDDLTSLPNRAGFMRSAREILNGAAERRQRPALLVIRWEDFSHLAHDLGGAMADDVLAALAARINAAILAADLPARISGAEFSVLLSPFWQGRVADITGRIHTRLVQPMQLGEHHVVPRIRIGYAEAEPQLDPEELLRRARLALAAAEQQEHFEPTAFHPDMLRLASERLDLEQDVRRAVDTEQFELHFEPVVELETLRVLGFEALARWPGAARKLGPNVFIPTIESLGLDDAFFAWSLRTAVAQVRHWRAQRPEYAQLWVGVNVSPRQFARLDLAARVAQVLGAYGLPGEALVLEVTEGGLVTDNESTRQLIQELRRLRVRLAIDDFGTGYSSLSYLSWLQADILKIDRSFLQDLAQSPKKREIVRAILAVARELDMTAVAEGIETHELVGLMYELGCLQGQGWHFSRSLSPRDVLDYLEQRLPEMQAQTANGRVIS
jgi:diguanylate cyclase (GGDEF)-like protein